MEIGGRATALGVTLLALPNTACLSSSGYQCGSDEHCDLSGQAGRCEPQGGCSYLDDECPSGRRFSANAPGALAGQCTDPLVTGQTDGTTTNPSSTGPIDPPDDTTSLSSGLTTADSTSVDSTTGPQPVGWRREITLGSHPLGPVDDVPVRIMLDPASFDFDEVPDHTVLRFFDDDQNLLPHEVEWWSDRGAELWVQAPMVDTVPTTIWMWHSSIPEPALPAGNVWAPALGVWHLGEDLLDSSLNGNDGLSMSSTVVAGPVAQASTYTGDFEDYDDLPTLGNSGEGSIHLWFRGGEDQPASGLSMMFHAAAIPGANGYADQEEFYVAIRRDRNTTIQISAGPKIEGNPHFRANSPDGNWLDDQWHHVVGTWSIDQQIARLWVDGEPVGEDDVLLPTGFDFISFVRLGGVTDFDKDSAPRGWNGDIDEVRVYDTPLPEEMAGILFAVQQFDFATVGAPQPLP